MNSCDYTIFTRRMLESKADYDGHVEYRKLLEIIRK